LGSAPGLPRAHADDDRISHTADRRGASRRSTR
jgi:hypothetical protein